MLTCIARPKQSGGNDSLPQLGDDSSKTPTSSSSKPHPIKSFISQFKDMALEASGAYKHCSPCNGSSTQDKSIITSESESVSERFRWTSRSFNHSRSFNNSRSRQWGKEMEARLKGMSSGEGTPSSASSSGRRLDSVVVFVEENEPKEWEAQVEPGVLITFVSLPRGGNELKRIRFSRDMFSKWQAQKWWAENFDKVMELYNVQGLNRQAFPLPTPPRSEDGSVKMESADDIPLTPPLARERLPRARPTGLATGYSSSDSFEQHSMQSRHYRDSGGHTSTPKLSSISGAKTEASSMDASTSTSSSKDAERSREISISNASDLETEWVEEDEPGVYITIRSLPNGTRELRRVRFSREKFGEMHARVWWEENRKRVHEQYL